MLMAGYTASPSEDTVTFRVNSFSEDNRTFCGVSTVSVGATTEGS